MSRKGEKIERRGNGRREKGGEEWRRRREKEGEGGE
jgi:hypothetical protein